MNKQLNVKVETVRRFFSDSKASNHPVKEHPISKTDEYIRNMYKTHIFPLLSLPVSIPALL